MWDWSRSGPGTCACSSRSDHNMAPCILVTGSMARGLDHLRGGAAVHPGAGEGDKLVTSLVDHEPAHLALVALLPEPPGNSGI